MYWDDVNKNIIKAAQNDCNFPQSNYLPPERHIHHHLCQINVPEISDGRILLYLGASTHVSGSLKYFSSQKALVTPRIIHLAVADCTG